MRTAAIIYSHDTVTVRGAEDGSTSGCGSGVKGVNDMMTYALKAAAPLALAASLCSLVATSALAASVVNGLALKNATPAAAEQVRWRGGRGWGYARSSGPTAHIPITVTVIRLITTRPPDTRALDTRAPDTRAPVIRLMPRRLRRRVATRWVTACSGSDPSIRDRELISATTAIVIPARKRANGS